MKKIRLILSGKHNLSAKTELVVDITQGQFNQLQQAIQMARSNQFLCQVILKESI